MTRPKPKPQPQTMTEAIAAAAGKAYEFQANLAIMRNVGWMEKWEDLTPNEQRDWKAMVVHILPPLLQTHRHALVAWMREEAIRLGQSERGITDSQREVRIRRSGSLISAIAYLSVHGMDGHGNAVALEAKEAENAQANSPAQMPSVQGSVDAALADDGSPPAAL